MGCPSNPGLSSRGYVVTSISERKPAVPTSKGSTPYRRAAASYCALRPSSRARFSAVSAAARFAGRSLSTTARTLLRPAAGGFDHALGVRSGIDPTGAQGLIECGRHGRLAAGRARELGQGRRRGVLASRGRRGVLASRCRRGVFASRGWRLVALSGRWRLVALEDRGLVGLARGWLLLPARWLLVGVRDRPRV